MTLNRLTAIAVAGMIVTTAAAYAAPLGVAGPQVVNPDTQIEQIYYRNALPAAIVGGLIAGVVGGALLGGGCYFNDCYDYPDGGYYGGAYYGGYNGGHYAGRGWQGRAGGRVGARTGRTWTSKR